MYADGSAAGPYVGGPSVLYICTPAQAKCVLRVDGSVPVLYVDMLLNRCLTAMISHTRNLAQASWRQASWDGLLEVVAV